MEIERVAATRTRDNVLIERAPRGDRDAFALLIEPKARHLLYTPTSHRCWRRSSALSVEQRHILVLHHLHGLPLAQIAVQLRIPVGTAKSRLWSARRALERALEAER